MSPNHRPFIAVTVHYEKDGNGVTWLLDIVEMARSHSGINLAETFTSILAEYGIEKKVSLCWVIQRAETVSYLRN